MFRSILYLTIVSYAAENTWVQLDAIRNYLRNTLQCLCVSQASTESLFDHEMSDHSYSFNVEHAGCLSLSGCRDCAHL